MRGLIYRTEELRNREFMANIDKYAKEVLEAKQKAKGKHSTLLEKEKLQALTSNLNIIQRDLLVRKMKELDITKRKRAQMANVSRGRREGWMDDKIDVLTNNINIGDYQAIKDA